MIDVRGRCDLHQSNRALVELDINQPFFTGPDPQVSENIRGTALVRGSNMRSTEMAGRVVGNRFFLVIHWNTGSVGEYHGTFVELPGGHWRLSGSTFDRRDPGSQATWFVNKDFLNF
jgi:hypothetical protein